MSKRVLVSIAVASIPFLASWFILQDHTALFADALGRLVFLSLTAFMGIMCYTYPGWED